MYLTHKHLIKKCHTTCDMNVEHNGNETLIDQEHLHIESCRTKNKNGSLNISRMQHSMTYIHLVKKWLGWFFPYHLVQKGASHVTPIGTSCVTSLVSTPPITTILNTPPIYNNS